MSDIRFNNAMDANTNVETEHVTLDGGTSSSGSAHASDAGVGYDGSAAADVSYDARVPDVPDTPDLPQAAADATATLDATANDVSAHADGALGAAGGLPDLPEAPELDGSVGGGLTVEAWLDALGELAADVSASVSALFGL